MTAAWKADLKRRYPRTRSVPLREAASVVVAGGASVSEQPRDMIAFDRAAIVAAQLAFEALDSADFAAKGV
jgi:hypothetical protein